MGEENQPDQGTPVPEQPERGTAAPEQGTPVSEQGTSEQTQAKSGESQEEADVPKDAPEGYEPQVQLQPGQTGGIEERPGEQVSDVEANVDDQDEASADQGDDEAVDDPQKTDNPGESG